MAQIATDQDIAELNSNSASPVMINDLPLIFKDAEGHGAGELPAEILQDFNVVEPEFTVAKEN